MPRNNFYAVLITLLLLFPVSLQLRPLAVPVGSFYITAVEIIIFFLFSVWAFQQVFTGKKLVKGTLFGHYIIIFLIMFSVYLLFGLIFYGPVLALGDFRQYFPIILYFPIIHFFNFEQSIGNLRKKIFFVLITVAIYTIILFVFFNDFMAAQAIKDGKRIVGERIYIVNSLAVLFAYLGFVVAILLNPDSKFFKRILSFIIVVINAVMLLIMQSRSLWVMFSIILLLSAFSFKNYFSRLKYILIGFYSVFLFIAIAYFSVNVFNYTPSVVKRVQNSIIDRVISFKDLAKIGQKNTHKAKSIGTLETRFETAKRVTKDYIIPNFFLGSGFGSQIPMVNTHGMIYKWKFQIDNAYLTILAKFGLLGFLLYGLFAIKIVRSLFAIIRSPKISYEDSILAKSFLYMIIALILGAFFSSIFIRQQPLIVGFLIMIGEIEFMHSKYKSRI